MFHCPTSLLEKKIFLVSDLKISDDAGRFPGVFKTREYEMKHLSVGLETLGGLWGPVSSTELFVRGSAFEVNRSLSTLVRTWPGAASCEVNGVLLSAVNSRLFMGDYLCCRLSVLGAGRLLPVLLPRETAAALWLVLPMSTGLLHPLPLCCLSPTLCCLCPGKAVDNSNNINCCLFVCFFINVTGI